MLATGWNEVCWISVGAVLETFAMTGAALDGLQFKQDANWVLEQHWMGCSGLVVLATGWKLVC
jgi:hypothetical protein